MELVNYSCLNLSSYYQGSLMHTVFDVYVKASLSCASSNSAISEHKIHHSATICTYTMVSTNEVGSLKKLHFSGSNIKKFIFLWVRHIFAYLVNIYLYVHHVCLMFLVYGGSKGCYAIITTKIQQLPH